MHTFSIRTAKHKEVIDISDRVNAQLIKLRATNGVCHLFVLHTTCALTTCDLDPGTDADMLEAIEKMFPAGTWRHGHDPNHVGEHIMSSIIGPSVTACVENGEVHLGTWQRLILIELSGPRTREICLHFIKTD